MSRRPTPLDNEQCRQCQPFKDYVKKSTKNKEGERDDSHKSSGDTPRRPDCPLDREELGNKSWGLLHTIAAKYPENPQPKDKTTMREFFTLFSKLYPCQHCAEDLKEDLLKNPPRTESQEALSQWLCRLHNRVNVKIGKEEFDCSKVNERWRDGWADGSCD
ncbi:unnamed protein product [Psylliodes chrysocephalus]|uniref:Sulfhydryl oxidase n=1 Tax=Psylliodes chrysocephalus TaxID=3402493 RepID=A0A9P0CKT4_9CUCU|nr:unnamed protein product [Psylliodes chrysocephala]